MNSISSKVVLGGGGGPKTRKIYKFSSIQSRLIHKSFGMKSVFIRVSLNYFLKIFRPI